MTGGKVKASQAIEELGQVIGRETVVKLCEALGGIALYVPRAAKLNPHNRLVRAIGMEAAAKLATYYHGTTITLPSVDVRRKRALQLLKEGNHTVGEVALATGYSERHVYRIMQTPAKRPTVRAQRQRAARAVELLKAGQSFEEVRKETGYALDTLRAFQRRHC